MMNLFAAMGVTLPLLFGVSDSVPFYTVELGGAVVEQRSGQPFPSFVPVSIKLYSGSECVATATADLDGRYSLRAPPGEYWAQILLGEQDVAAEKVTLSEGSWEKDFRVPMSRVEPLPTLVAGSSGKASTGVGGSGASGGVSAAGSATD